MALDLGRYGSREILKLQMFDAGTNKPIMYFDYANTASHEWAASRVYATGAGVRRIAWDGDKTETLTVETQIFTMQHLALLAGEDIKSGSQNIYKTEILQVQDDGNGGKQIVLSKTPVGGATNIAVYKYVNGIITEEQTVDSVTTNTVKLATTSTVNIGDEVEVYYQFQATSAKKLSFTAKGFPKYVKLVGDTLYQDEVSKTSVAAQIIYHKAKLQPNFSISMSSTGDPTSLSLVFDLFSVKVGGVDITTEIIFYDDEE